MKKLVLRILIMLSFSLGIATSSSHALSLSPKKLLKSAKKRVKKVVNSVEKRGKELEATVRNVRDGQIGDAARNLTKFATKSTGIDASFRVAQDGIKTIDNTIRSLKAYIEKNENLRKEIVVQKEEVENILNTTEKQDVEVEEIISELESISKLNQPELVALGVSRSLAFISFQLTQKDKFDKFLLNMSDVNKNSMDLNMYYFGLKGMVDHSALTECLMDLPLKSMVINNKQEKILDRVEECFEESLDGELEFSDENEAQRIYESLIVDEQARKIYAVYEQRIRQEIETPVELIKTLSGVRLGFQEIKEKGRSLNYKFEAQIQELDIKISDKKQELAKYEGQ